MATHEMDTNCVQALEQFLKKNADTETVRITAKGAYNVKNKTITNENEAGTRLVLSFPKTGTDWSFRMPEIENSKRENARSLRYTGDHGIRGVTVSNGKSESAMNLEQSAARTFNTCGFGHLFRDFDLNSPDDAGQPVRDSEEEAALFSVMQEAIGSVGSEHAHDMRAVNTRIRDQAKRLANGTDAYGRGSASNPLYLFAVQVAARSTGQRVDVNDARRLMGLDDLDAALVQAGNGKDLSELLTPGTPEGRRALVGLTTLSYYKKVKDNSDVIEKDGVTHVRLRDDKESVYLRGCRAAGENFVREESRIRSLQNWRKICPFPCVQRVRAEAMEGKPVPDDCGVQSVYRAWAEDNGGAPFNGPCGIPDYKVVYRGSADGKLDESKICVEKGPGDTVPLREFLRGDLSGMPMLDKVMRADRNFGEDIVRKAAGKMFKDNRADADIAELEMTVFYDRTGADETMRSGTQKLRDKLSMARGKHGYPYKQKTYLMDAAAGLPDRESGTAGTGFLRVPGFTPTGKSFPERNSRPAITAAALRREDAPRRWPHDGKQADAYLDALDGIMRDESCDVLTRSAKMNDFMVLTDTYCRGGMPVEDVLRDVEDCYAGKTEALLYRPQDDSEMASIREACKGCADIPRVAPEEQGTARGFGKVLGSEAAQKAASMDFLAKSFDRDTLYDTRYRKKAADVVGKAQAPQVTAAYEDEAEVPEPEAGL